MSNTKTKIHFIGIGGIGASALAQYYLSQGAKVSGTDLLSSEITEMLKKKGAKVVINPKNQRANSQQVQNLIRKADLIIYSRAVPENHPELKLARRFRKKCLTYSEALGELTKQYFTIAVCGTHGKSTTCAMIALILIKAGLNPTVILGTKLKEFGDSNFRMGGKPKLPTTHYPLPTDKVLIIEADEHFASFLNYLPNVIVITNIEPDHLDFYKNFKNYLKSFEKFVSHLPKGGILIVNGDDKNIKKIRISNFRFQLLKFSIRQKEAKKLKKILKVPGKHNLYNALASYTCAQALGVPNKIILEALSEYKGAWRRLEEKEIKLNNRKVLLISDYGHHPTEIQATIEAIKEKYPKKKIWLVFQPHQYQRTFYLWNDFVKTFRELKIEKIVLLPIYEVAGREKKLLKKKISSDILAQKINDKSHKAVFVKNFQEAKDYIVKHFTGEILVVMGAGDVYNLGLALST